MKNEKYWAWDMLRGTNYRMLILAGSARDFERLFQKLFGTKLRTTMPYATAKERSLL